MTSAYPTPEPPSPPPAGWPNPNPDPDPVARPLAGDSNIQGNVLASFNKDHLVLLFVTFPTLEAGRAWLTELVPRLATNAAVTSFNARFSRRRRASGSDPADMAAVWTNISFTSEGLSLLAPEAMADLSAHTDIDPGVQLWIDGAATAATTSVVGDTGANAPTEWLFGQALAHAVVCVAADRSSDLDLEVTRQRERAAHHGVAIVFEQPGATLPGKSAGHEQFGFKDGISQPGVRGYDELEKVDGEDQVKGKPGTDPIAAGTFVLGYNRDGMLAVPVPKWMFDGSFLVTRRLTQDVPGFWQNVEAAFATLQPPVTTDPTTGIPSADALAARMVGRWRSGTPTDHAPVTDNRSAQDPDQDNHFDFEADQAGDKTPACAHIRKVYPRSGAESATPALTEDETRVHRILRRGIPFGPPFDPTAGRGSGVDAERGLLFQCYQASLADQFVFLQQAWINDATFPDTTTGPDPLIGVAGTSTIRGAGQDCPLTFQQWVKTRGSLFSFTPSIPTVTALAAGAAMAAS